MSNFLNICFVFQIIEHQLQVASEYFQNLTKFWLRAAVGVVGELHLGKTDKADLPELAVGPLTYLTYDLGQDSLYLL